MKGQSASQTPTQQFLSFALNSDKRAMLSTQQLVEIIRLDPASVVQIPEMPSAVVGVCPWQGEVLWLVDLSYLIGGSPLLSSDEHPYDCSILKVRTQTGNLGLVVAKIGKLVSCDPTQIQPPGKKLNPSQTASHSNGQKSPTIVQQRCIQGYWTDPKGTTLMILDVEAVVESLITE